MCSVARRGTGASRARTHLSVARPSPGRPGSASSKAPASSQTCCHFASIACGSYVVQISPPDTKKPLDREAVGSWRGAAAVASLRYARSCFICFGLLATSRSIRGGRMAGYTKVNLKDDVEDQAPNVRAGERELEARMARVPARAREAPASATGALAPNFRVPFGHHHKHQEEVYVRRQRQPATLKLERRGRRAEAVRRASASTRARCGASRRAEGRGGHRGSARRTPGRCMPDGQRLVDD